MNEMRKLMETLDRISEEGWRHERERLKSAHKGDVRYDPQPGDDEPLNHDSFMAGDVKVEMRDGEVTLSHGHGENIFLSYDEWSLFINGINNEG